MAQQTLDLKTASEKILTDISDDYTKIGPRMMIRAYGISKCFELTSECAGTDGNVVLTEEDVGTLRDFLNEFYPLMREFRMGDEIQTEP